jgi:hypothetical protein
MNKKYNKYKIKYLFWNMRQKMRKLILKFYKVKKQFGEIEIICFNFIQKNYVISMKCWYLKKKHDRNLIFEKFIIFAF